MMNLLRSAFQGSYVFKRMVAPSDTIITGKALFKPISESESEYIESGSYVLNGVTQDCFQKQYYLWKNNQLTIKKRDGILLHQFHTPIVKLLHQFHIPIVNTFPIVLEHRHVCKMDNYTITITIFALDLFQTIYEIKGPKKNSIIKTDFVRCG